MTALLRFPAVPAIYVCHGWLPWEEAPPQFPRIRRYVAVDYTCRDRLVCESAIPEERVSVLLNFVDLRRFKPRGPLPSHPKRALVFSNNANEHNYLGMVREVCVRFEIELDVMGLSAGTACARPEEVLGNYDLVFAKARAALEALAVGAAVVLCDAVGTGPMVTMAEVDRLRSLNFGIRTLNRPITSEALAQEIARYDAADAAAVSARIRAEAGREPVVDQLIELYRSVIKEHEESPTPTMEAEGHAAVAYLRWLSPRVKERDQLWAECEHERAKSRLAIKDKERPWVEYEREKAKSELAIKEKDRLWAKCQRLKAERKKVEGELALLRASPLVRLRDWLLRAPHLPALYRALLRRPSARNRLDKA